VISLLEIAKSINEADDDKYVSIGFGRFKLKGKEDDDSADVFVKTDSGKYVKSADQKSDDDGGEKPEEPQGGKLGGSDFERDFDDKSDEPKDSKVDMKNIDSFEDSKKFVASLEDVESDLSDLEQNFTDNEQFKRTRKSLKDKTDDMDVHLEDRYYDGIQGRIDDVSQEIYRITYDDPNSVDYKDDTELQNKITKVVKDKVDNLSDDAKEFINNREEFMKKLYDPNEYDIGLKSNSDDNAESDDIEISDANSGPIDRDDIMDMLKNDSEVVDKMGDDVYWDGVDLVSSKFDDDTIASVDGNMTLGDLKKQIMDYEEMKETINVNLKEKYDRIFRSLKWDN